MDKTELPGMLALSLAIQDGEWPHTMDAQVWADEFLKRYDPTGDFPNRGEMIGWFANAIMAGYDTARHEQAIADQDDGWLPIESAPRDGTEILLYSPGDKLNAKTINVGKWCDKNQSWDSCMAWYEQDEVTLWHPITPPPESK